jgi:hypothetical protein
MAKQPIGPFTKRIHGHNRDFKNLKMDSYTGKEDPVMHVTAFQSAYNGKGYTDEDWCHAFVNTLTQEAMLWFYQLEPESIDSYEQLVEAFTAEYATKSSFFYSVGELTGFQQNKSERLADYMERFKAAYRRCTAKDDVRAAQIFRDGLEPGEFLRKLNSSDAVLTYTELMNRAGQYARSYYLTYERKSQLNAMHKAGTVSAPVQDTAGDKRKQEIDVSRAENSQQDDKRTRGNSYRGNNRNSSWTPRDNNRKYDPPHREQNQQHRASQNWQQRPVYQVDSGTGARWSQQCPARPDPRAYSDHPTYREYSSPQTYGQQLACSPATGVNQIVGPNQGWTETGYNRYPRKKSFGRGGRSSKYGRREDAEVTQSVCTVFNTPIEEIYKQNPHLFPQQWKKPPYAGTRTDTRKYCTHHQSGTHNTEDCQTLRGVAEQLYRDGKLDRYADSTPQGYRKEIFTISGGPTMFGTSRSDHRSHVKEARQHLQCYSVQPAPTQKRPKRDPWKIGFSDEEETGIITPHDDPLVISAKVHTDLMHKVLVDGGSSANIIFKNAYLKLDLPLENISRTVNPLISFSGETVQPLGSIWLNVEVGQYPRSRKISTHMLVVDCESSYNFILGRPTLCQIKACVCYHLLTLKFPTTAGIASIRGSQPMARSCYAQETKPRQPHRDACNMVTGNTAATDRPDDPREGAVIIQGKPQEEVECISLFPEIPDRTVKIGTGLPVPLRDGLIRLLKENASIFAWSYADMPGISTKIISHKLGIDPAYRPVRQKRRISD